MATATQNLFKSLFIDRETLPTIGCFSCSRSIIIVIVIIIQHHCQPSPSSSYCYTLHFSLCPTLRHRMKQPSIAIKWAKKKPTSEREREREMSSVHSHSRSRASPIQICCSLLIFFIAFIYAFTSTIVFIVYYCPGLGSIFELAIKLYMNKLCYVLL